MKRDESSVVCPCWPPMTSRAPPVTSQAAADLNTAWEAAAAFIQLKSASAAAAPPPSRVISGPDWGGGAPGRHLAGTAAPAASHP